MQIANIIHGFYRAIFKGDSYFRYSIFSRIVNIFSPQMVHTEFGKYFLQERPFYDQYTKFEWQNFNSYDRKYMISQFLKLTKHLTGDTAECGAYKWSSSYIILNNISSSKTHHMFDSFEWLSKPLWVDGDHRQENSLTVGEEVIRHNLSDFPNTKYYKWWIPEKFSEVADLQFSFVYIDVDLYQPTKDSLEFFYPRMQKWWIIMCDDSWFVTCPWARKAMQEFAEAHHIEIVDLSSWQGLIVLL